jgi:DNA-binding NtrC family response regulator
MDHLVGQRSPDLRRHFTAAASLPARDEQEDGPELDRQTVEHALQQVGGNRSAAARILRISRRALYRRLDSFGLR